MPPRLRSTCRPPRPIGAAAARLRGDRQLQRLARARWPTHRQVAAVS